jgi:hypothetical protein
VELAVDVNLYALSEVSFLYCEVAKTRVSSEHVGVPSDGPGVLRTHMCCYVVYPICLSNLLQSLLLSPAPSCTYLIDRRHVGAAGLRGAALAAVRALALGGTARTRAVCRAVSVLLICGLLVSTPHCQEPLDSYSYCQNSWPTLSVNVVLVALFYTAHCSLYLISPPDMLHAYVRIYSPRCCRSTPATTAPASPFPKTCWRKCSAPTSSARALRRSSTPPVRWWTSPCTS